VACRYSASCWRCTAGRFPGGCCPG
jgi:hypothetical protein